MRWYHHFKGRDRDSDSGEANVVIALRSSDKNEAQNRLSSHLREIKRLDLLSELRYVGAQYDPEIVFSSVESRAELTV